MGWLLWWSLCKQKHWKIYLKSLPPASYSILTSPNKVLLSIKHVLINLLKSLTHTWFLFQNLCNSLIIEKISVFLLHFQKSGKDKTKKQVSSNREQRICLKLANLLFTYFWLLFIFILILIYFIVLIKTLPANSRN